MPETFPLGYQAGSGVTPGDREDAMGRIHLARGGEATPLELILVVRGLIAGQRRGEYS